MTETSRATLLAALDALEEAEARHLAERLCQAAPLAVRATKEVAVRSRTLPWVEAVRFGETMRLVAGSTADAAEGRAAARDKRAPHWQGK